MSTINVLAKSIHATGIKLNKTTLNLKNGTKEKLKATVTQIIQQMEMLHGSHPTKK